MKFLLRQDIQARGHRYSNKHLLTLEAAGKFPRRIRLAGGKTPAWVESEIEEHEAALVAARDAQPPKAA